MMQGNSKDADDAQRLVAYYRRLIMTEQIKPGDRLLSLHEMQEIHDVSAAAAAEVFKRLHAMSLATTDPGPTAVLD
jgi:DNA-binding FadR family transcriptional regulator